jgi:hypothetical protein
MPAAKVVKLPAPITVSMMLFTGPVVTFLAVSRAGTLFD